VLSLLQWKSNKCSECVFRALGTQHAMRMRHNATVACLIVVYDILPRDLINGTIKQLLNTKRVFRFSLRLLSEIIEHKTYVSIFSTTFV
jgi:hypothetical protein